MISASKALKLTNKSKQKVIEHILVNLDFRIRHDAENGLYQSVINNDERDFHLNILRLYSISGHDIWKEDILPVLDSEGYDTNIIDNKLSIIWHSVDPIP